MFPLAEKIYAFRLSTDTVGKKVTLRRYMRTCPQMNRDRPVFRVGGSYAQLAMRIESPAHKTATSHHSTSVGSSRGDGGSGDTYRE